MKRVLTDAKIRRLKAKDKAYKVTDGGGLYIYITKAGTKSFRYDAKLNERFTLTLGTYPEISLADARKQHEKARADIAKGIDPQNTKQQAKPFSYYFKEMMAAQDLRPATQKKKLSKAQCHLFKPLDRKQVTKITAIDLLNLLKPIAEAGKRETAKHLATYCRQTFNYLLSLQLIENNPAATIAELLPKPKKSINLAHITDTKQFAKLLRGIDSYQGDFAVQSALKLASLAILRPFNIRFLRWEYIDFKEKLITIPEDEMKMSKPHKVPLSSQTLAILKGIKPLTGRREFVFLTSHGLQTGKPMSENTLNQALMRVKDPETDEPLGRGIMTSHGFRHTASTLLNEMRFDADAIELQLAHASKDRIRDTYNKAELMPARIEMMQQWANYLDGLKAGADVVPINSVA